jgi:uncharacterized protein YjiS (DUF1127 family)
MEGIMRSSDHLYQPPLLAQRPSSRALAVRGRGPLATLLGLWLHRARSRRALRQLDARALRDVGLSPGAVQRESAKPFWR